ncbi:MAG: hypothetical protein Q8W45_07620 [Candidatus Palauibacterales bacterium]|jgi:hypothetical protein|nr:hypothetical protein [Candidatus Palauibacterales bacterium]MDP2483136.1 hypothetical protein [Candidatus Palauibacterales bacterium]
MCKRRLHRGRAILLGLAVLGGLGTGAARPAPAQDVSSADSGEAAAEAKPPKRKPPFHASPYLMLGSWEYPILDYWISAGRIRSLSPFVQPYRRIEVARALLEIDESEISEGEKEWLARLRASFAYELAQLSGEGEYDAYVSMEFAGGATLASQTHRDPLRAELDGPFSTTKLLGDFRAEVEGAGGPVAGAVRGWWEGIYLEDPQFPDGRVVETKDALLFNALDEMAFRMEEAYAEVQSRYARLSLGQIYRNWGAPGLDGFLRSDYAYSEPDLGYRLGTDRIFLIGSLASYRDFEADTAHYVAIHRLEFRPIDDLVLSVSEASVHGGPAQGMDFRLVNPLGIWMLARNDEDPPHNKMGAADIWWRATQGLTVYGSLLVDASRSVEAKNGGSLGFELSRLAPGFLLRTNFSFLQSLVYRARLNPPLLWEQYTVENIGIGWDKTDLYLVSLEGEWFPRAGLWVQPRLDIQIRGEGDLRQERPPPETLPEFPKIIVGDAETTIRPSVAGIWRAGWRFPLEVKWDVGVNFIQDYANTPGDNRTEFVGSVGVLLRTPRWTFGFD